PRHIRRKLDLLAAHTTASPLFESRRVLEGHRRLPAGRGTGETITLRGRGLPTDLTSRATPSPTVPRPSQPWETPPRIRLCRMEPDSPQTDNQRRVQLPLRPASPQPSRAHHRPRTGIRTM